MSKKSAFLKALSATAVAVTLASAQIPNTDWYTIPPGGIDGSEARPYEISTADELAGLAKLVNGDGVTAVSFLSRHIILRADINLAGYGKGETSWNSGRGWVPIGHTNDFRGTFEGNNKTITNLYINDNSTVNTARSLGLFGRVGDGGSVRNIGVVGVEISGTVRDNIVRGAGIGGVAGYSSGAITNCYSTGIVSGNVNLNISITNSSSIYYGGIGGVVGYSSGSITDCYSIGTVSGNISGNSGYSGTSYGGIGGLAGYSGGMITDCYSIGTVSGNISGNSDYIGTSYGGIGGLAGYSGGMITDCYSIGVVNGDISSTSSGSGSSQSYGGIGGIAGYSSNAITNSYSDGVVNGDISSTSSGSGRSQSYGGIGGIAGYSTGAVTSCYSIGAITGAIAGITHLGGIGGIGGIAGYSGGAVSGCYSTGAIVGNKNASLPDNSFGVGGVIGYRDGGAVSNCAALNPSITRDSTTGTNYNRVIGYMTNNSNLSRNVAFNGLYAIGGMTFTRDDRYGADITVDAIISDATMDGRFTGENGWTIQNGKLPGLFGNAVDFPAHFAPMFDGGDGTEERPYEIGSAAQFARFAQSVNGGNTYVDRYIKLTADINLGDYGKGKSDWNGGRGWMPVGHLAARVFRGHFDGGGKTVTGLYVNSNSGYGGLFGFIDSSGAVKNISVLDAEITIPTDADYAGGIAGRVRSGSIENANFTGTVAGRDSVGGIVGGFAGGSLTDCYSSGTVSGRGMVGGVVGHFIGSTLTDCRSNSAVSGTDSNIGGVVGHFTSDALANNYFTGTVTVTGAGSNIGGVVGNFNGNSLTNCYSAGAVTVGTGSNIGGVAGNLNGGALTNCYSTGAVDGSGTNVGGVAGNLGDGGVVSNCYATGAVGGNRTVGGVAGMIWGGSLTNCVALNPNITRTSGNFTDVGRVTGHIPTTGAVASDNAAFVEMQLISDGNLIFSEKTATGKDGADITASAVALDGTIGGRFLPANGWTVENGKLPGLFGETVDMPAHLASAIVRVNAAVPAIAVQPSSGAVTVGEAYTLTVSASVADGGTLGYQWYSNTENSNTGGAEISGATSASYVVPAAAEAGVSYYYAVVTNTIADNGDGGSKTATATSNVATVTATAPPPVYAVTVTSDGIGASGGGEYEAGATVTISAGIATAGTRFVGWTSIPAVAFANANSATTTFTMPANAVTVAAVFEDIPPPAKYVAAITHGTGGGEYEAGETVSISATVPSGQRFVKWTSAPLVTFADTGSVTTTFTMPAGAVTVTAHFESTTSVLTPDRATPTQVSGEAVVVAPVKASAEFAAGPNPVAKFAGAVNFFWQGKQFNEGNLTIYDVAGNIVRKITVSDNAVIGNQARRQVGSWDLTDGKGKPVPAGTYLVRGTITARDGRRERVSLVVGVR